MSKFRLVKVLAATAAACILAACANTKALPPLNRDYRNSLGMVGVITVGPAVGGKVTGKIAGSAVQGGFEGAATGAVGGAILAAIFICLPCALVIAPVGLVAGGIQGAAEKGINAIPAGTAGEIQASLDQAVADRDLQAELRLSISRYTGRAEGIADLGAGSVAPATSPDYAAMSEKGVGAVLEISLTQLALGQKVISAASPAGENPTLNVVMTARARMVRVSDGLVLWNAAEVKYESPAAQLALWTARDADLVKTEIANGTEALARQVGEAIFGARGMARAEP